MRRRGLQGAVSVKVVVALSESVTGRDRNSSRGTRNNFHVARRPATKPTAPSVTAAWKCVSIAPILRLPGTVTYSDETRICSVWRSVFGTRSRPRRHRLRQPQAQCSSDRAPFAPWQRPARTRRAFGVNETVRDVRSQSSVSNEFGAFSTCSTVCVPRFSSLNSGDL